MPADAKTPWRSVCAGTLPLTGCSFVFRTYLGQSVTPACKGADSAQFEARIGSRA